MLLVIIERDEIMELFIDILKYLGVFIAGAIAGFFLARYFIQKYMKKKM